MAFQEPCKRMMRVGQRPLRKNRIYDEKMVGVARIELATPAMSTHLVVETREPFVAAIAEGSASFALASCAPAPSVRRSALIR